MINLNLTIKSEQDFDHYFEILCALINLEPRGEDQTREQQTWEIAEPERKRLYELASHILEVFHTLV